MSESQADVIIVDIPVTQPEQVDDSPIDHPFFNDPDTDFAIYSNDHVRFRMHSLILRTTSEFFADMLALSPAEGGTVTRRIHDLHLDDDAATIEPVFRMISGKPILRLDSLETAERLLHFCEKYSMSGPISIIQATIIRPDLLEEPFKLYRLACRYGWPRETQLAAELSLKYDPSDSASITALRGIEFSDYARLLDLCRRRCDNFEIMLNDPLRFRGSSPNHVCITCRTPTNDPAWRVLRLVLVRELQRCPLGDTIRAENMMKWPDAIATWAATHCGKRLYDSEITRAAIIACLDDLATTLI